MESITSTPAAAGIQPTMTHICNVCKQEKPVTEFYRNKRARTGIHTLAKSATTPT